MTTCPVHGWNAPCHSCVLNLHIADAQMALRWGIGSVGGNIARKVFAKLREENFVVRKRQK